MQYSDIRRIRAVNIQFRAVICAVQDKIWKRINEQTRYEAPPETLDSGDTDDKSLMRTGR